MTSFIVKSTLGGKNLQFQIERELLLNELCKIYAAQDFCKQKTIIQRSINLLNTWRSLRFENNVKINNLPLFEILPQGFNFKYLFPQIKLYSETRSQKII